MRSRSRSPVRRDIRKRRDRRERSRSRERDVDRYRERDRERDRERRARDVRRRETRRSRSRSPRDRRERRRSRTRSRSRSIERERHRDVSPRRDKKDESQKEKGAVPAFLLKKPELTEKDLEGKTDDEIQMMKLMGFGGFDSTKGKSVAGNSVSGVHVAQKRKYRQYMNRKGGFNRPLDFVA